MSEAWPPFALINLMRFDGVSVLVVLTVKPRPAKAFVAAMIWIF